MGRAIARALAAEGCSVTLFARREKELAEEAGLIESDFPDASAHSVAGDSTDPLALRNVVDKTLERFSRLDIVVNNTGGPPAGDFGDFDDEVWSAAYELSVLSAIRLTRHALPALRQSGRGRVVNVTSSTVKELADGLLLANALRPSIVGWAKHLSREEGPNGITVNCIAPGYIDTDRLKYLYSLTDDPESARRQDAETIPARRFGHPDEIGATATFLCSRQADYISGITVLVDGGLARGLLS
jgi:3-oxoacyl-[acyl-carrier protein] reductase